jgi:murein L,D-transpeptidase YcbB/YkuD
MRTSSHIASKENTKSNCLGFVLLFCILFTFSTLNLMGKVNEIIDDSSNTVLTSQLIESSLKGCDSKTFWMEGIQLQSAPLILSFYNENTFAPVWTNGNELSIQSQAILSLLKDTYNYGIDPDNFDIAELENLSRLMQKENNSKKLARLRASYEFLMTNSVFTFMLQISKGTDYSFKLDVTDSDFPIISKFPDFLSNNLVSIDITDEILKLQPKNSEYVALQDEIEVIVQNTNPTDHSIVVPELFDAENTTKLLSYILAGESTAIENTNYDASVLLLEFQKNAGLRATGKLDVTTRELVNSEILARYADLAAALDQIRKENILEASSLIAVSNNN